MYCGKSVSLKNIDDGILELSFDKRGSSVNVLNSKTLEELAEVIEIIENEKKIKGLLITSNKSNFIVGADVKEFESKFSLTSLELKEWITKTHELFSAIENFPFPSVAVLNGMTLGGGFELALATDYRVASKESKVGLPEVNLGICPGWGGTVRLPRLIGLKNALNWMVTGKPCKAEDAYAVGAINHVVTDNQSLFSEALTLLKNAIDGKSDYKAHREQKRKFSPNIAPMNSEVGLLRDKYTKKLDPHYPAANVILDIVLRNNSLTFNEALELEADAFIELAKTETARNLVGLFTSDQYLNNKSKNFAANASPVKKGAVLGAGIMGGGVAYQSASKGIPIVMKDIRDEALSLGIDTATKILDKKIERGRLDISGKEQVLSQITPSLNYDHFKAVDLVVEAVIENPEIKSSVLAEVEKCIPEDAVLASNTSTISIDKLAEGLSRPDQFCGMHFFNPVHQMPLVEVIRGKETSEEAISRTVAYASAMGKKPIVVNDCPGFLVNRILFPYFNGFNRLLLDGVDYERIDHVMEQFGWPMGPAYLADVVGIDTMVHADQVIQKGFPERMTHDGPVINELLLSKGSLGQKSGEGYYSYGKDEKGRRFKKPSIIAQKCINDHIKNKVEISDQEIIDRMMIPMCLEAVRCLSDGIVESAVEVDMGLILGLGFPRFRGGALRYIDNIGLAQFVNLVKENEKYGPLYKMPQELNGRCKENHKFY
ncbi:MAG: fatty acid oxidation complex subunit alpha FadB [Neptuniibacter sp.]